VSVCGVEDIGTPGQRLQLLLLLLLLFLQLRVALSLRRRPASRCACIVK
jgi:hypothetical protein